MADPKVLLGLVVRTEHPSGRIILANTVRAVLEKCDELETDSFGEPSIIGRAIAESFRAVVAEELGLEVRPPADSPGMAMEDR